MSNHNLLFNGDIPDTPLQGALGGVPFTFDLSAKDAKQLLEKRYPLQQTEEENTEEAISDEELFAQMIDYKNGVGEYATGVEKSATVKTNGDQVSISYDDREKDTSFTLNLFLHLDDKKNVFNNTFDVPFTGEENYFFKCSISGRNQDDFINISSNQFRLKITFGDYQDGITQVSLYLALDDENKSFLAGTFFAIVTQVVEYEHLKPYPKLPPGIMPEEIAQRSCILMLPLYLKDYLKKGGDPDLHIQDIDDDYSLLELVANNWIHEENSMTSATSTGDYTHKMTQKRYPIHYHKDRVMISECIVMAYLLIKEGAAITEKAFSLAEEPTNIGTASKDILLDMLLFFHDLKQYKESKDNDDEKSFLFLRKSVIDASIKASMFRVNADYVIAHNKNDDTKILKNAYVDKVKALKRKLISQLDALEISHCNEMEKAEEMVHRHREIINEIVSGFLERI